MEKFLFMFCMECGLGEGKSFFVMYLKCIIIGWMCINNYLIKDFMVFQKYVFIEWQVDYWVIVDIGSFNGMDVNGYIFVE